MPFLTSDRVIKKEFPFVIYRFLLTPFSKNSENQINIDYLKIPVGRITYTGKMRNLEKTFFFSKTWQAARP